MVTLKFNQYFQTFRVSEAEQPSPKPVKENVSKVLRVAGNSPAFNIAARNNLEFRSPVIARGAPKQLSREHQQMSAIYDSLVAHQSPEGRILSTVFMKLPSKTVSILLLSMAEW